MTDAEKESKKEYAGFWLYLLALLVDGIILFLTGRVWRMMFGLRLFNRVGFVLGAVYYILLWVNWDGQSIGKRLLKIKIIRVDGRKMDVRTAILRYFAYCIFAIPLLLGFFWIIWKEKQGWHDKIAGTVAVKE